MLALGGSRKRSRQQNEVVLASTSLSYGTTISGRVHHKKGTNDDNSSTTAATRSPLKGVVICLTGIPPEDKEQIHKLVEILGGSYTRDLNSAHNTHLIAVQPEGHKYEAALTFGNIYIVRPTWLYECHKQQQRVDEMTHLLLPTGQQKRSVIQQDDAELLEKVDMILQNGSETGTIFSGCQFFLEGFDIGSNVYKKLATLIRRGRGIILWECHGAATHVIVHNHDVELPNRAPKLFITAFAVSPGWVISSWLNNQLACTADFPPCFKTTATKDNNKKGSATMIEKSLSSKLPFFRESLFVILRVPPTSGAVDFHSNELEEIIHSHGGTILSIKLVDALESSKNNGYFSVRKKCYVISWGGNSSSQQSIHPLLRQIRRGDLCEVIDTTPIWLKTCVSEQKVVPCHRYPYLFIPNNRPIFRFGVVSTKQKESTKSMSSKVIIRISITGFSGSQRSGLIHLIEAMGATYDDSMRSSTTHLVCSEASGQKYETALKRGMYIVSIEWIFHIAKHGYHGPSDGVESRFSITKN